MIDKNNLGKSIFHILSLITVCVWGTTFVSTKILISSGLNPIEIFTCRFLIAYLTLLLFCHKKFVANSLYDEFLMFLAGISGGSLYFITENTALELTYASTVSLLICTTPLFTMLITKIAFKTPLHLSAVLGSCIAFCGVGLVVFNGSFQFDKSLKGEVLTLLAAISWAFYCLLLKILDKKYDTLFITRKVFFYGLISAIGIISLNPAQTIPVKLLLSPIVISNLIFLGVVASLICYIIWNSAVKNLGADKTANYIYITPLVTILTAVTILDEPFTWNIALGSCLIIGGVWMTEHQDTPC